MKSTISCAASPESLSLVRDAALKSGVFAALFRSACDIAEERHE